MWNFTRKFTQSDYWIRPTQYHILLSDPLCLIIHNQQDSVWISAWIERSIDEKENNLEEQTKSENNE